MFNIELLWSVFYFTFSDLLLFSLPLHTLFPSSSFSFIHLVLCQVFRSLPASPTLFLLSHSFTNFVLVLPFLFVLWTLVIYWLVLISFKHCLTLCGLMFLILYQFVLFSINGIRKIETSKTGYWIKRPLNKLKKYPNQQTWKVTM